MALALEDGGGQPAALAAAADRGDRLPAGQLAESLDQVGVGHVDRAGNVALGELVAVPDVEHHDRWIAGEPLGKGVGIDQLDPLHRTLLSAPGGHAALEEAANAKADGRQQLGRLELVAVRGGDDDQLHVLADDPGHLGGKAGVVGRGADRPGDVGLVELLVRPRVDQDRALGDRHLHRSRGERRGHSQLLDQRSAVQRHDVLDVGRALPELVERGVDERFRGGGPEGGVVLALEADRRGRLVVDRGAPAHRSAEMAGPDLHVIVQGQQAPVQRIEDRLRAVAGLDRQIRARDVADEQRVAGQDRPGIVGASGIVQHERGVLGAVAGRMHRLDLQVAHAKPPAVGERLVRILGPGELVDVDRRPGGPGQPTVPGDVVRVVVGLEHVLDPNAVKAAQPQVGIDVPLRIDHRGHAAVANQVRAASEVLVDDLAKEHQSRL